MSDVKQMIEELVAAVGTPKYAYNCKEFNPEKDTVFYSGPYWDEKEVIAGVTAFLTGKWLVSGEQVGKFQWAFGHKFNVKHCHMVNSGSSANLTMVAALKKHLGWKDGDQVIVSPVGFPTTIAPLVQNGLVPIFVDIEMETLNFNLSNVENRITDKTVAIFVSPVLGNPPDMDKLQEIANKHNLILIGDNCDSLGSKYDGKNISDYYSAFSNSFYPAHHISTGEGGMVCSNDNELKSLFVSLSWWGRDCYCVGSANLSACGTCQRRFDNWLPNYHGIIDHKYVFANMGYNLKPLDLQGAIGLEQLKKFDEIDLRRKKSKQTIEKIFIDNIKGIRGVKTLEKSDPCWFGTPFICENFDIKQSLVSYLEKNKIQTRNYFAGNILLHPGYSFLDDFNKYPEANQVLDKVFFVGAAPHYSDSVFNYIEKVVKGFSNAQ